MNNETLEFLIRKWNPHFGNVKKSGWPGTIERTRYLERLEKTMNLRHIVILSGVRRSGKSTLMRQLIGRLIEKGVDSKNLLYLYLEDLAVQKYLYLGADLLEKFYNFYLEKYNPKGRIYVFFDELQGVKDFNHWLHSHYEFDRQAKFIISGSRQSLVESETATLLTGRNVRIDVYPFNFAEYLEVKGVRAVTEGGLRHIWGANFEKRYALLHHLAEFLDEGGYPEIVLAGSRENKKLIAGDYYSDIIAKDVAGPNKVRAFREIEILGLRLLSDFAQLHTYRSLGRPQDLAAETVKNYLEYFYRAYLFFESSHFSYKTKETQDVRKPKKIYVVDNGLRNFNTVNVRPDWGAEAENVVYMELFKSNVAIYYWKGKQEVDFVVFNPEISLYNVSYSDAVPERETAGMVEGLKAFKLKKGTILTKNYLDTEKISGKTVEFVPLWAWLLAQGGRK